MRVGSFGRAFIRSGYRDERGISLVVVSVSLLALIGGLMLAVDAGNVWQTRRQIITATDATVLQEARAAALTGPSTACAAWTGILQANGGNDVQPIDCSVTSGLLSNTGYVTVEARKPAAVRFGGLLGIGNQSAYSLSGARFDVANNVLGLRPIGFCVQNQHVQEWLAHINANVPLPAPGSAGHPIYPGAGVVHHMPWERQFQDGACGTTAGNWGWLDFNGSQNPTPELDHWLRYGFDENSVAIGDCNADNATPNEMCEGDTGSRTALKAALDTLLGESFPVVVYDYSESPGANSLFKVWGFLGVKLWGYRVTGPDSARYFDMEFTRLEMTPGATCCSSIQVNDLGGRVIRLCAVDHDPLTVASRCGS